MNAARSARWPPTFGPSRPRYDSSKIRKGSPRARAIYHLWVCGGCERAIFAISRPIGPPKPPYHRNGARGPRLLLNTNRKSHTRCRLIPKSMTLDDPELTLNGHYALCYITQSFGAHQSPQKIWMKIDLYYQRQKCRPEIDVSSNIRFMQILRGSLDRGVKWDWGRFLRRFSTKNQYVAISRKRCILDTMLLGL